MRRGTSLICGALLVVACQAKKPAGDGVVVLPGPVLAQGGTVAVAVLAPGLVSPFGGGTVSGTARLVPVRGVDGAALVGAGLVVPATVSVDAAGLQHVEFDLDTTALPAGIHGLEVVTPGGGTGRLDEAIAVLAPPALGPPQAASACLGVSSDRPALRSVGEGLPVIDGAGPAAHLLGGGAALPLSVEDCRALPFARASLQLCRRITARAPAGLAAGFHGVEIHYPAPFAGLVGSAAITVVSPPVFDLNTAWLPKGVATDVTVDFLRDESAPPTATLAGRAQPVVTDFCEPTSVSGVTHCRGLGLEIPADAPSGQQPFALTLAGGCTAATQLKVAPTLAVTSVQPAVVCNGGSLVVHGTGFLEPAVMLGGGFFPEATCTASAGGFCTTVVATSVFAGEGDSTVQVVSQTRPPSYSPPFHVTAISPMAVSEPMPRVVYNGSARQLVLTTGKPAAAVTGVSLWPQPRSSPLSTGTPLAFTAADDGLHVALPAGVAQGPYALVIEDGGPCPGASVSDLQVWGSTTAMNITFEGGAFYPPQTFRRTTVEVSGPPIPPEATLVEGAGNPGVAAHAGELASPVPWYFSAGFGGPESGFDLALYRFDLKVAGAGAPTSEPHVIVDATSLDPVKLVRLERSLDPLPGPTWTHYELRLDDPAGWTVRDADGTHAPTADELRAYVRGIVHGVSILGSWTDGTNEAWLDNLGLELAR